MATLRKSVAYRKIERPYTRVSKFKKLSYIRMTPTRKVVRYDMGDSKKEYDCFLDLIPKSSLQIRQEAIESARMTAIRLLEKVIGKTGDHFKIRNNPTPILRENPLAAGAGADRMSTGMQKSFGKPIGVSLQIREGEKFFSITTTSENIATAKTALVRASKKMPCSFTIQINQPKAA